MVALRLLAALYGLLPESPESLAGVLGAELQQQGRFGQKLQERASLRRALVERGVDVEIDGEDLHPLELRHRALREEVERAERGDLVAPQLDAKRQVLSEREHIHDAAANRELSQLLHRVHALEAHRAKPLGERRVGDLVADFERQGEALRGRDRRALDQRTGGGDEQACPSPEECGQSVDSLAGDLHVRVRVLIGEGLALGEVAGDARPEDELEVRLHGLGLAGAVRDDDHDGCVGLQEGRGQGGTRTSGQPADVERSIASGESLLGVAGADPLYESLAYQSSIANGCKASCPRDSTRRAPARPGLRPGRHYLRSREQFRGRRRAEDEGGPGAQAERGRLPSGATSACTISSMRLRGHAS